MDNSLLIQKQIKDNAEDLHNYVRDLKLWEEEMKRKDRQLSNEHSEEVLPPVRRPKLPKKSPGNKEEKKESTKKKILSYDYKSWDQFDVEKACKEIDNEDDKSINQEENYEETAAQEEKYLKEKGLYEKELGNKHVKACRWDEAIKCYTKAIEAYPKDPIFFANRALCYLKIKNYELVETDCTESLKLDSTYVKAMLRRAAAREALDRIEDARYDLRNALKLEPSNTQAHRDLARLQDMISKQNSSIDNKGTIAKVKEESKTTKQLLLESENKNNVQQGQPSTEPEWENCSNTVQPIFKPPHLRSKKSLKRIEIYDVGPNNSQPVCKRKVMRSLESPSTCSQSHTTAATTNRPTVVETSKLSTSTVKSRSILTVATAVKDVPPLPSTSVQFHNAWSTIKADPLLCYRFIKQIPGESFPSIFKESLESGMFSSIILTLASEFIAMDEPVVSYLQGLCRVKRFSTLALFMSPADKCNLNKLFDHCLMKGECLPEEMADLRRIYEMT